MAFIYLIIQLVNIKKKLKAYNQDYIVNSNKPLVDYLCNSKYSIFPKVRYSERPDVASINILKGYIVLLIDTSSCCIILPTSIFELNEQLDEYHLSPFVASFIRIIKYLLMVLALYILPVWFLLCVNKNERRNPMSDANEVVKHIHLKDIHSFPNRLFEVERIAIL